ncbi:T-cell antigen CD7 [Alligator mississippiensis]|uniref:T-cell antigen CD7 n=1 Tax=Alligator mississippiensis TaxID=8496 RepID=A0A151N347_ALLMI|nr:T-cell antigen CD7 [Alligator mississippiensis]
MVDVVQNDAKRAIIEQSPAFIRVPEGDSIKITCLLKTEGEEEGVYLMRLHAADKKVVYVPKDGNKNTFDNFVGRIETSGPTKNLTITLQQLRPNDSDFYYCLGLMRDANFQTGKGTGTLVIVTDHNKITEKLEAPISGQKGDSINITCVTETKGKDVEVYLMRQYVDPKKVIYIPSNGNAIISSAFTNRIEYSGPPNNRTITLQELQQNDTDVYVCVSVVLTPNLYLVKEMNTIMVVTAGCILPHVKIKKYFQNEPNAVYEEMSSRRSHRVTAIDNPYDNCK